MAEESPLYWGGDVVYVPLHLPSSPARGVLSKPGLPDTIRRADTVRAANTVRAADTLGGPPDTLRVPADTVRIAQGPVPGQDAPKERRIETVERRLLDEGVFRAFEVNFAFNSAALQPRATRTLDAVGAVLERHPGIQVEIGGHTDAVGTRAFNWRLSRARAQAVRTYLLERFEIAPERLLARGYGEARPVAPGESPAGRALNRRVEFEVLSQEGAVPPGRRAASQLVDPQYFMSSSPRECRRSAIIWRLPR